MRSITLSCAAIALGLSSTCVAQDRGWEVGGAVGFGVMRNASVDNASGSAAAGMDNRFVAGAVLGQDLYQHFSGELRYVFRDDDLVLKSGGQKVNMDGDSHLVHYDVLFHPTSKESRIRPFVAAGGGIRLFRATGQEYVTQPLSDFALLTKTNEIKPLISVGGGVKYQISPRLFFRAEFRDYITQFPTKVITPIPGNTVGSWLNNFVPMFGLSYIF